MLTQKQKIVLTVIIVLTLILGAGTTFFIMRWRMDTQRANYTKQITTLNTTIQRIGPIQSCYSVLKATQPGGRILQSDLKPVSIPESCIGESYILDPASIVGKYYKVSIEPGTPITADMIMDEKITDDLREVDIVADNWPIGLKEGDYIDYRLVFPKGEDFVVLTHLRVMKINTKTIKVHMTERELLFYGASLVEKYIYSVNGSYTYMTKYLEPGVQKAATVSYCVPDNIRALIIANPNILDKAVNGTLSRSIVERSVSDMLAVNDGADGQAVAQGRSDYLSKLEEARKKAAADTALDGDIADEEEQVIPVTGTETETKSTPTVSGEEANN